MFFLRLPFIQHESRQRQTKQNQPLISHSDIQLLSAKISLPRRIKKRRKQDKKRKLSIQIAFFLSYSYQPPHPHRFVGPLETGGIFRKKYFQRGGQQSYLPPFIAVGRGPVLPSTSVNICFGNPVFSKSPCLFLYLVGSGGQAALQFLFYFAKGEVIFSLTSNFCGIFWGDDVYRLMFCRRKYFMGHCWVSISVCPGLTFTFPVI